MKKPVLILLVAALLGPATARAGDVGVNINLNLGGPPVPIIVEEPPLFLVPPLLGFSVAVGVPYDMFLINGRYYLYRGSVWYVAPGYGGPWTVIVHDRLPPGLRKHKYQTIVRVRDEEYHSYQKGHYTGKSFRPEKEKGHGNGKAKGKHKGHD